VARHRRGALARHVCGAAGRARWATFAAKVRPELQRIIAWSVRALWHAVSCIVESQQSWVASDVAVCCRHYVGLGYFLDLLAHEAQGLRAAALPVP
jgi:hypothetical protein